MPTEINVILSLGTNIAPRHNYLQKAVTELLSDTENHLLQKSDIYETEAWGNTNLAPFLNQIIVLSTLKNPHTFLKYIFTIEGQLGRKRTALQWCARTIDIDILFWGNVVLSDEALTIPHPAIEKRKFILQPLADMGFGDYIHPVSKKKISTLLNLCSDNLSVKKIVL